MTRKRSQFEADSILTAIGVIAAAIVGGGVVYYFTVVNPSTFQAIQMVPTINARVLHNSERIDFIRDDRNHIQGVAIERMVEQ